MKIFGVTIEGITLDEVIDRIKRATHCVWIVTANPEILLEAHRDPRYAHTLEQADIRTVDGVGLAMVGRCFGSRWARVTGVELGERLIAYAAKEGLRIGLIGGAHAVAQAVAAHWYRIYPNLILTFEEGGRIKSDGIDDEAGEESRHRLTLFAPDILLVAFGHPKQERWIARYLADLPQLKIVMGVGGSFDYWAGSARRAPLFFQRAGFEWLWRLCAQPSRIRRIFRAVVLFPVLAIADRYRSIR